MIINGVNYYVRVTGEGKPLIALHGFTGSSTIWSPDLFPFGYRLLAPDLLGHGQTDSPSDPARYSIDAAARDLIELITRLTIPPVTLLGYSMGGRLALHTALTAPHLISSLILESTSPGIENEDQREERRRSDHALSKRIESEGLAAYVHYWENIPLFSTHTPAMRDHLRPIRLAQNPRGLANSLRGMGTGVQPNNWSRLQQITMPVLLITGEFDTKFTVIARHMSRLMPNTTLATVPGTGHTIHLEQPDLYRQTLAHFLTT